MTRSLEVQRQEKLQTGKADPRLEVVTSRGGGRGLVCNDLLHYGKLLRLQKLPPRKDQEGKRMSHV